MADTFQIRRGKKRRLSDEELKATIDQEIRSSIGYIGGETSESRRKAMKYYLGELFGNEQDGRSQVVSSDLQDVVESMLPDFMEMFASGDSIVRFTPRGPEDEPAAKQATDYVNYVWLQQNNGFAVIHDWIKDALIQQNGIIKQYWEKTDKVHRETLENVNSLLLEELLSDPNVEIIEQTMKPVDPDSPIIQFAPDGMLFDITILRTVPDGQIRIVGLPPEEFLISRRAVSLDEASFTCHKVKKTLSQLREEGFDEQELENIPSHDTQDFNEERVARFPNDDEWPDWENNLDPAMREIWVYECYIKTDYDGDGIAEMNQVFTAGRGHYILTNPESGQKASPVDDHPFHSITPVRMPHKFFGRSMYDLTADIQLVKSTIERQILDDSYNATSHRALINDRVDLDDYLNNKPGQPIHVEGERSVGEAYMPIPHNPISPQMFSLLEYMDTTREERTGVTRYDQGMDENSLNKTATGINLLLGRTQKRKLLMARVFAETGFKPAMKRTLQLLVQHQDRAKVIRLRNEWVEIDPRGWDAEMDLEIAVGLAQGTSQDKMQAMANVLQIQEKIAMFQQGIDGPLVTAKNLFDAATEVSRLAGYRHEGMFFSNPEGQQQQPKPDPAMAEVEMKGQIEQAKLQVEQQKNQGRIQAQVEENRAKLELRRQELAMEMQHEKEKLAAQMQFEREKAAAQLQVEREKAALTAQIQRESAAQDARTKRDIAKAQGVSLNVQDSDGAVTGITEALGRQSEFMEEQASGLNGVAEVMAQAIQSMAETSADMSRTSAEIANAAKAMAAPKKATKTKSGEWQVGPA